MDAKRINDEELRKRLWNLEYLAWCQLYDLSFGLTREQWLSMKDTLSLARERLNELMEDK